MRLIEQFIVKPHGVPRMTTYGQKEMFAFNSSDLIVVVALSNAVIFSGEGGRSLSTKRLTQTAK